MAHNHKSHFIPSPFPDVRQRAAAKKELENGSLKRELDEVKEKIAYLKKILK